MNRRQADYAERNSTGQESRRTPRSHVRGPPLNLGASTRLRQIPSPSGTHSQPRFRVDRDTPSPQPPRPLRQGFFRSSRNVEVSGGNFNNNLGHHTDLTINVNQLELGHLSDENSTLRMEQPLGQDRTQVEQNPANAAPQKSSEVYARLLSLKGRGFPLWIPEPHRNLPIVYRRKGVKIGDVGIITPRGGFSFLFNIFTSNDDPMHPPQLPERFTPLSPSPDALDICLDFEFKQGNYLASSSIEKSAAPGLSFKMSASEGAILTMPEGAASEDLENVARIREYVAANLMHWYRYVNGPRGRDARNGDIRVVVGCDKSTSWGMATMTNTTQEMNCQLKFIPIQNDSTSGSSISTYVWEHSGLAEVRTGPDVQEIEKLREGDPFSQHDGKYTNQCLFLRTINPTLGNEEWLKLCQELDTPEIAFSNHHEPAADNRGHHIFTQNTGQSTSPGVSDGTMRPSSQRASGNGRSDILSTVLETNRDRAFGVSMSNPPTAISFHPSRIVNVMLLKKIPNAKMVITEDSNWCSIFNKSDHGIPSDEELFERVLEDHQIEDDNGVVFLEKKCPRQGPTGLLVSPSQLVESHLEFLPKEAHHIADIASSLSRYSNSTTTSDAPSSAASERPSSPSTKSSASLSHSEVTAQTDFSASNHSVLTGGADVLRPQEEMSNSTPILQPPLSRRHQHWARPLALVVMLVAFSFLQVNEFLSGGFCGDAGSPQALVKMAVWTHVCLPESKTHIPAVLTSWELYTLQPVASRLPDPNEMVKNRIGIGKISAAFAAIGTTESHLMMDAINKYEDQAKATIGSLSELSYASTLTHNALVGSLAGITNSLIGFPKGERNHHNLRTMIQSRQDAIDALVEGLQDELKELLSRATETLANLDSCDFHLKQVIRSFGRVKSQQLENAGPEPFQGFLAAASGAGLKNIRPAVLDSTVKLEAWIGESSEARKAVVQLSADTMKLITGIEAAYRDPGRMLAVEMTLDKEVERIVEMLQKSQVGRDGFVKA